MKRPICSVKNCQKPVKININRGKRYFSKLCAGHINLLCANRAGFKTVVEWKRHLDKKLARKRGITYSQLIKFRTETAAKRKGFDSVADYKNASHPYRRHKKNYCENRDGRLGWKCTTKITSKRILQVDHKNGKPNDNRLRNLQTLCSCCHTEKGFMKKDHLSPGRRKLKCK